MVLRVQALRGTHLTAANCESLVLQSEGLLVEHRGGVEGEDVSARDVQLDGVFRVERPLRGPSFGLATKGGGEGNEFGGLSKCENLFQYRLLRCWEHERVEELQHRLQISVAVVAEIPVRSSRKLSIFVTKKRICRIKVSKNK